MFHRTGKGQHFLAHEKIKTLTAYLVKQQGPDHHARLLEQLVLAPLSIGLQLPWLPLGLCGRAPGQVGEVHVFKLQVVQVGHAGRDADL